MVVGLRKGLANAVYDTGQNESYFVEGGSDTISGSTVSVSFTNEFASTPIVIVGTSADGVSWAGSTAVALAKASTGSFVATGDDGLKFNWLAYGKF